ncbi:MAG: hypothetical protein A2Y73_09150 [Chloroflexi bacterium RBG_13_56_8]|nr:MAG: hypothetical protein A2Y73_09150 [Chloroflexi bacterium RBG_13_56_8]
MREEASNASFRWILVGKLAQEEHKMTKLYLMARNLLVREEGASLAEYGLLVALIAVVCIGAITLLGGNISDTFNTIAGQL